MEFLLALVAPSLTKCLEICFLTGFATAHRLECSRQHIKGGVFRLAQPRRRQKSISSPKSTPRTVPNDPEREGNIWTEYELLKKAHQALEAQLEEERTSHKKELNRLETLVPQARTPWRAEDPLQDLPPVKRPEERTNSDLARELSDVRSELERMEMEVSDAHNQVEFLQSEKSVLASEIEKLRKSAASADSGPARRRNSASVQRQPERPTTPFEGPTAAGPTFSDDGASKAGGKRGLNREESLSSFGSDIEFNAHLLPGAARQDAPPQPANNAPATYRDARLPRQGAAQQPAQAFAGGTVGIARLQEMNKKLVEENQRLQAKMLRLNGPGNIDPELQEKYNRLMEENTRLQGKVLKLDLGAGPQEPRSANAEIISGLQADLTTLQTENAELRDDNDKLVNYLESLEQRKKELEDQLMTTSGTQHDAARVEQLNADNAMLLDKVEKLKGRLKEGQILTTQSSFQSIPIPVAVETGDELDKDLWLLVEDLRDQNRTLLEEQERTKKELEDLKSQSSATSRNAMDSRSSVDSDSDRQGFATLLTEENTGLQNEVQRLTQRLGSGIPIKEREVLNEALKSNERLIEEKREIVGQLNRMVARTQRLAAERDRLLKQIHSTDNIAKTKENLGKADSGKGILGRFSRGLKKKPSEKVPDVDDESVTENSANSLSDVLKRGDSPSKQLVQDLLEENSKLSAEKEKLATRAELASSLKASNEQLQAENNRLEESMITMKELTDDNEKLIAENQNLTKRLEDSVSQNQELSHTLIDVAMQNEEDMIENAFGGNSRQSSVSRIDTVALQQRCVDLNKLTKRISEEAEHRERDSQRRKDLNSRASRQLQEFSSLRSLPSRAGPNAVSEASPWGDGGSTSIPEEEEVDIPFKPLPARPKPDPNRSTQQASDFSLFDYIDKSVKMAENNEAASQTHAKATKEKVARAFIETCGNDDLGSFMKVLGYKGFEPLPPDATEEQTVAVYKKALQLTSELQLVPKSTSESKLLAFYAHEQLQEWYLGYLGAS